ncbi:MAG: putative surface protein with fasciclin (FAS1) repeats, partial [Chitinophagales bacterium]
MKKLNFKTSSRLIAAVFAAVLLQFTISAQSNVFDDVINTSPDHTYLAAALSQEGLDVVLQDPSASYTVFAPDNDAFDALAAALETDIAG